MTSLLAGLIVAALGTLGSSIDTDAVPSELHYSVQFDQATGSASLRCEESSSGHCTFWFGDGRGAYPIAAGSGTLDVGDAPAIVRVAASRPAYCASPDESTPPKWPDCTHGPLGGAPGSLGNRRLPPAVTAPRRQRRTTLRMNASRIVGANCCCSTTS